MPLALGLGSGLALTLTLTLTLILTLTLTLTLTMTLTLTLTLTRPCLRWVGARAHRVQGASARILVAMRALANLGRSFTTPPPPPLQAFHEDVDSFGGFPYQDGGACQLWLGCGLGVSRAGSGWRRRRWRWRVGCGGGEYGARAGAAACPSLPRE